MKRSFMAVFAVMMLATGVFADYKYYTWTTQYITMFPGGIELEFYSRYDEPVKGDVAGGKWRRQMEIEAGITDRWDASLYFVERQRAGTLKFDEMKLRTRYKLMEEGGFIADPMVYAAYKLQTDRSYPDKWEFKFILARDVGDLNMAVNYIFEESYLPGRKVKEWKHMYAAGTSYPLVFIGRELRLGVEFAGDLNSGAHYAGPSIAYKEEQFWFTVSPVFGLTERSDYIRVQGVIGLLLNIP